ncbi:MAG TPA: tetratricopeptide repeat protein [Polyangiaceae bacterium]|jgi:tetratricopeptide (TPR) repeat protein|nr:tetratricopeptide repeat protein [Polyangiaceae bacterium]
MPSPRAVVIPFGVPEEGRGLGLGLAALVHSFAQVDGAGIAIAQLEARTADGSNGSKGQRVDRPPSPVEAFLSPAAWRDIAGRGDGPSGVAIVVTGAFEPPAGGPGTIQLLAFDPRDGRTCAKTDAPLDEERTGASLVSALDALWTELGGGIGALASLGELEWESLESVLRAERCALHDPARGGRHDRLAAMAHLGRAIGDAPEARYPAERLASIALETATSGVTDQKLALAAVRALERAVADAGMHVELAEALAATLLRIGQPREAERRMNAAIAMAPTRARPYALLAQALRAQGRHDAALAALAAGTAASKGDLSLTIERGMVLTAIGDTTGAEAAFREVLAADPVSQVAYGRLGAIALRTRDAGTAQWLIDAALAAHNAHPDVLRGAVRLALESETEGLARASRVSRLCERLVERVPDDAAALLVLARAQIVLGEKGRARARLDQIERIAPKSAAAAEAHVARFALEDPRVDQELTSVLRAARTAAQAHLADVAARGRHLANAHGVWTGFLAAAIAERRCGRLQAAARALDAASELAPGAPAVRFEMGNLLLGQRDASGALACAEAVIALDGPTTEALGLLARAQAAADRRNEAIQTVHQGLAAKPDDEALLALLVQLREPPEAVWPRKWGDLWKRWRRA